MKIFLASCLLKNIIKIGGGNLAGEHPVKNGNDMKVYLAGERRGKNEICEKFLYNSQIQIKDLKVLETFFTLRKNTQMMNLIQYFDSFLLDSGAFTFLQGTCGSVNWDEYIEEYANFINRYNIKLFFELDIDNIVGLSEVERLRLKLEKLTHKTPIVVWHKNRGKEYFEKMCKNYPYVALGGIVIKEIPRKLYERAFPWFISVAHKNNAKIHGLGYTSISGLKKYHFDSVDSSSWLLGNRAGYIEKFDLITGNFIQYTKENSRLKSRESAINNFIEWVKFSKWAEKKL